MALAAAPSPPKPPLEGCAAAPPAPGVQSAKAPSVLPPAAPGPTLAQLQALAEATNNDRELEKIGQEAAVIEAGAEADLTACNTAVAAANAALKRLPLHSERRERAVLLARQAKIEADQQEARTALAAASQTFNLVAERRRNEFSARILRRSASPFSPPFWSGLASAGKSDLARFMTLTQDAVHAAADAQEPRGLLGLAAGLLLLLVLLFPGRLALERWGQRKSAETDAPGAFARTAHALWLAAVDTVLPALAGVGLHVATQWGGLLSDKADALAGASVVALTWGAAILALGRALVTDKRPDQRLLDLPTSTTERIQRCLWAVAVVTGTGFLLTRLNFLVGASVAATIAANSALSLAYAGVAVLILLSLRGGSAADEAATQTEGPRSSLWTLISLILTVAIMVTLIAVATGYSTLATLISGQIFWLSVIAAATYLLLRFADELCHALFFKGGWAAQALVGLFGMRRSTIEQIGVVLSAAIQLLIVLGAATLALTPFGASGDVFIADLGKLGAPLHVGTAVISPMAIATGLVSLGVGLAVVHVVRLWFVRRYLPVTGWDIGLRSSVSTGVTYLGVGLTVLCALGAMGLGFQQIALVASALSVGIGFGLQQVVQNFVSGIILLIERPVKVGDWVVVDKVEGDIRRIRVRATEIQTFDRSTVIVPNSDLITKSVQNRTHGDPRGRIQLQVSIANPADARKAKDLIAAAAKDNPKVLADPPPAIYIDSLAAGGAVNFNCYLYVASPRDAYKVRSELYFEVLERFQKADIGFIGAAGPQTMVVEPGPALASLIKAQSQIRPLEDEKEGAAAAPPGPKHP